MKSPLEASLAEYTAVALKKNFSDAQRQKEDRCLFPVETTTAMAWIFKTIEHKYELS